MDEINSSVKLLCFCCRRIDVRADKPIHEYQVTALPVSTMGYISDLAVGPSWLTVIHSVGLITTLDLRTGFHIACWPCSRAMEGELTQVSWDCISKKSQGLGRFVPQKWVNSKIESFKDFDEQMVCIVVNWPWWVYFALFFFFFSIFTGFDMLNDADSGYKNNAIVTVYLYSLY